MQLTKEQKLEMQELSKLVYGSAGRAEKILRNGQPVVVTRTKLVEDTKEDGTKEMKEVKEAVTSKNGKPVFTMAYPSYEELMTEMQDLKTQRDTILAQIKQMQAEASARQEEQKKLNESVAEATGSSL